MKCDELQYERLGDANKTYPASTLVIRKQFVDAAIAELKAENERLKKCEIWMMQHFYCEEVIACESAKNRKLKRALWMARKAHAVAMFAYWDSHYRDNPNAVYRNRTVDWLRNRWVLILDAIIKKEKAYK